MSLLSLFIAAAVTIVAAMVVPFIWCFPTQSNPSNLLLMLLLLLFIVVTPVRSIWRGLFYCCCCFATFKPLTHNLITITVPIQYNNIWCNACCMKKGHKRTGVCCGTRVELRAIEKKSTAQPCFFCTRHVFQFLI